jgi:hypothetical protein
MVLAPGYDIVTIQLVSRIQSSVFAHCKEKEHQARGAGTDMYIPVS